MKKNSMPISFTMVRGLDLRVTECEMMLKRSKEAQAQRGRTEQLVCARMTLERAELIQRDWRPRNVTDANGESAMGDDGLLPDMTYSLDGVQVGSQYGAPDPAGIRR